MFSLGNTIKNRSFVEKIDGKRLYLRKPVAADAAAWVNLRLRNIHFHAPFSPQPTVKSLTIAGYKKRLAQYNSDWRQDRAFVFFICTRGSTEVQGKDAIIGTITIGNVVRGAGQMASLGYWLDEAYTRQGYMTEALDLAIHYAFHNKGLHRLQAASLPENAASIGVLKKSGFVEEGIARQYIRIAGVWRDHLIFSRTAEAA